MWPELILALMAVGILLVDTIVGKRMNRGVELAIAVVGISIFFVFDGRAMLVGAVIALLWFVLNLARAIFIDRR